MTLGPGDIEQQGDERLADGQTRSHEDAARAAGTVDRETQGIQELRPVQAKPLEGFCRSQAHIKLTEVIRRFGCNRNLCDQFLIQG